MAPPLREVGLCLVARALGAVPRRGSVGRITRASVATARSGVESLIRSYKGESADSDAIWTRDDRSSDFPQHSPHLPPSDRSTTCSSGEESSRQRSAKQAADAINLNVLMPILEPAPPPDSSMEDLDEGTASDTPAEIGRSSRRVQIGMQAVGRVRVRIGMQSLSGPPERSL